MLLAGERGAAVDATAAAWRSTVPAAALDADDSPASLAEWATAAVDRTLTQWATDR